MSESQYNEIIKRLDRIEELLNPLSEDTSYKKKIISNVLGNIIWSWLNYGGDCLGPGLTDIFNPGRGNK